MSAFLLIAALSAYSPLLGDREGPQLFEVVYASLA
jgi:hypothetical protein